MEYKPWVFNATGRETGPAGLQRVDGLTLPTGGIGFLSRDECAEIIRICQQVEAHEAVTGDGLGARSYSSRKSKVREIYPHESTGWFYKKLDDALRRLNGQQYNFEVYGFFEGAQYYDYPAGGYLDWHMDIAKGYMSNRKLSMSIQLTDGSEYDGGNLEFAEFREVAPRGLGDLIVFPSFLRHRVTEVTRGSRKCIVSWVHGPAYR